MHHLKVWLFLFHRVGRECRPVGFRSRTLTLEKNYSQLKEEALALILGVTRYRDYLLRREFTLVTDHNPLMGLIRSDRPTPAMVAARIQRWAIQLGSHRYKPQYKPEKLLLNADFLIGLRGPATSGSVYGGESQANILVLPQFYAAI